MESIRFQKTLNRTRVTDFEKDIRLKLTSLDIIEREMKEIGQQRKEWLDNISQSHIQGAEIYQQRIALIKVQAEMCSVNLKLDMLRLEQQYETLKLANFVAATQPLSDKETFEDRQAALVLKARRDNETIKVSLLASLDYRLSLANIIYDLSSGLRALQMQSELEQAQKAQELQENVEDYKRNMQQSIEKSQSIYREVIKEYLILRHNAQVAQEILSRSQNDASSARSEIQGALEAIRLDADEQRRRLDAAATGELTAKLDDLRALVIAKEQQMEEEVVQNRALRKMKKGNLLELKKKILLFEGRYRRLQTERQREVTAKQQAIIFLKRRIEKLEVELSFLPPEACLFLKEEDERESKTKTAFKTKAKQPPLTTRASSSASTEQKLQSQHLQLHLKQLLKSNKR